MANITLSACDSYTTDAVRRVITESLLPWTLQWLGSVFNRKWEGRVKQWTVQEQAHRGDYEQFDDYLEMVPCFVSFAGARGGVWCNATQQCSHAHECTGR